MCKNKYELIKFENDDFSINVNISPNEETVWLSLDEMSKLFCRDRPVIGKHVGNIFKEQLPEYLEKRVKAINLNTK